MSFHKKRLFFKTINKIATQANDNNNYLSFDFFFSLTLTFQVQTIDQH